MSRLGKVPIVVPKDVKVSLTGRTLTVEGKKGHLSLDIPTGIELKQENNQIQVNRISDIKQNRANHGTVWANIRNMIVGVTEGHKKEMEIQGVGLRAQLQGQKIVFSLGFSHPVEFSVPKEVKASVPTQTSIIVEGIDKTLVGQVAAKIRALKRPEPYKGKGIRYVGEKVKRKQGKSVTK
jgi:large subunit ribosomal protein L6